MNPVFKYLESLNFKALYREAEKPCDIEALRTEARTGPVFSDEVIHSCSWVLTSSSVPKHVIKWVANHIKADACAFDGMSRSCMDQMQDWLATLTDIEPDMTPKQALANAISWHTQFKVKDVSVDTDSELVFTYDTYHIVKLTTKKALKTEGDLMGHCVGGYYSKVRSGSCTIYSLRSQGGRPHVTIEVDKKGYVSQCQGKQNTKPHAKYRNALREFFTHMKLWSGVLRMSTPDQLTPDMVSYAYNSLIGNWYGDEYGYDILSLPCNPDLLTDAGFRCYLTLCEVPRLLAQAVHPYPEWLQQRMNRVTDHSPHMVNKLARTQLPYQSLQSANPVLNAAYAMLRSPCEDTVHESAQYLVASGYPMQDLDLQKCPALSERTIRYLYDLLPIESDLTDHRNTPEDILLKCGYHGISSDAATPAVINHCVKTYRRCAANVKAMHMLHLDAESVDAVLRHCEQPYMLADLARNAPSLTPEQQDVLYKVTTAHRSAGSRDMIRRALANRHDATEKTKQRFAKHQRALERKRNAHA